MLSLRNKWFFTFGVFLALGAPWMLLGNEASGSRSYWLLNPKNHIEKNQEDKAALEACISRLGFAQEVRITPKDGKNVVAIDVLNVSSIPITGLVVQPRDDRFKRLNLDSRTRIDFDPLLPNQGTTYTETVEGFISDFPLETSASIAVWDVVNLQGVEIVEHIFWSQWPLVSSDEELALAEQEFCGLEAI